MDVQKNVILPFLIWAILILAKFVKYSKPIPSKVLWDFFFLFDLTTNRKPGFVEFFFYSRHFNTGGYITIRHILGISDLGILILAKFHQHWGIGESTSVNTITELNYPSYDFDKPPFPDLFRCIKERGRATEFYIWNRSTRVYTEVDDIQTTCQRTHYLAVIIPSRWILCKDRSLYECDVTLLEKNTDRYKFTH